MDLILNGSNFEDQLQEEPGAKETQQKLDEAENLKTYYDKWIFDYF